MPIMLDSSKLLSDIIAYSKYARWDVSLNRREVWVEIVDRNKKMNLDKFPHLKDKIEWAYSFVYDKKVLPSLRSLQFAGKAIEEKNQRIFNCSYTLVNSVDTFGEIIFLLLCGCGVGYSIQRRHTDNLPLLNPHPAKPVSFVIGDSIEGWCDAVNALIKYYFGFNPKPVFDFSKIRSKGTLLKTSGGKAPGSEPLMKALQNIDNLLNGLVSNGCKKLKPIHAHDIICFLADCVVSGGIRRSALIALFDADDEDMLNCKKGEWWKDNPQRARANNSVVLLRSTLSKELFLSVLAKTRDSGCGEPGVYLTNHYDFGTNPCLPGYGLILSKTGIRRLSDLDINHYIFSKRGFVRILDKINNGIKPVYKAVTKHGIFFATKNHNVISNGSKTEFINAVYLDVYLYKNPFFYQNYNLDLGIDKNRFNFSAFLAGLLLNSGVLKYEDSKTSDLIYLSIQEVNKYITQDNINFSDQPLLLNNTQTGYLHCDPNEVLSPEDLVNFRESGKIPENFFKYSILNQYYWIAGFISPITYVKSDKVEIHGLNTETYYFLQNLLLYFGVPTENENVFLTVKEKYLPNFYSLFKHLPLSFISEMERQIPPEILNSPPDFQPFSTLIQDISFYEDDTVYDITVSSKDNTFLCNSFDVSNCAEIGLSPHQFCNLTTVKVSDVTTQQELNERVSVASFLGTLQASYTTNFPYIRDIWKETTEREALLGVSLSGVAQCPYKELDFIQAAEIAVSVNEETADLIGIKPAARVTCIKPDGNTGLLLGCGSGIHGLYAPYYLRRIRLNKEETLYKYLIKEIPQLLEDCVFNPETTAILTIPLKSPENAVMRNEGAIAFLERVKYLYIRWIKPGHISGVNTHNISCTVNIKDEEWDDVINWMWENRDYYAGISLLPYDTGTYVQAPLEECDEATYNRYINYCKNLDLSKIQEFDDLTSFQTEFTCSGGLCEITSL